MEEEEEEEEENLNVEGKKSKSDEPFNLKSVKLSFED